MNAALQAGKSIWQVYIIETQDKTLYTGITNDLANRWLAHQQGKGAKYFRLHKPEKIVYVEACANRSEASKREAEIKKLTRLEKELLIQSA